MSDQPAGRNRPQAEVRTWSEEIEVAGDKLIEVVKQAIEAGNVNHIVIRGSDDNVLLDIPLLAGVAITILMPWLVLLGAIGAAFIQVKVEVIRQEKS